MLLTDIQSSVSVLREEVLREEVLRGDVSQELLTTSLHARLEKEAGRCQYLHSSLALGRGTYSSQREGRQGGYSHIVTQTLFQPPHSYTGQRWHSWSHWLAQGRTC